MQPDVYTAQDVAAAARVPEAWVENLLARGEIRSLASELPAGAPLLRTFSNYISHDEAVRAVRALAAGLPVAPRQADGTRARDLFGHATAHARPSPMPLVVSSALHGLVAGTLLLIGSMSFAAASEPTEPLKSPEPVRLVFLATPGPGGGGGGGGLKMKAPPPKAERKGRSSISSPIPVRRLPPPLEVRPRVAEPPPTPIEAKVLPPVMAPVITQPADNRDREGLMAKSEQPDSSAGPGSGGGTGAGRGTGLGDGDGSGIGDGSGGGTGGGPYRPGSGVDPPRLLREVRADYSDAARRANIEGEVVLEIVVTRDGTVGDVRVLKGLGLDLNDRAIQAVRQWRFAPARLKGTPVDVVVEVAVDFRLR
ncbi:MAG TPA: TonB family protein [Vicinamibacterales bacterium]|nr:TonB family protein [Vicinamibacterales bacterium]